MATPEPWISIGRVFLDASLEILPLFLLAILIGAMIEEFVTERTVVRFLTGRHPGTMLLASVVGAVIPLCTCGMVPLAISLRRRGGDLKHTFGFLTAGAAVSVPVLLLTWRILGAGWIWQRFVASVALGLLVGYASLFVLRGVRAASAGAGAGPVEPPDGADAGVRLIPRRSRARSILRRFVADTREYAPWVIVSLLLAAVVDSLVPRHWIHVLYGQKSAIGAPLAAASGVPFYFCSGAELPLLKELLVKGMGHGPAVAMMLAVPIVNIPTFGVVARWLGPAAAARYLGLCWAVAALTGIAAGLISG